MPCTKPSRQRRIPVRLRDVPLERRMQAAQRVARVESDPDEIARVFLLAVAPPSDVIAWVRP